MVKREHRELISVEELPEHRAKQVEAGLATFHHMSQQVDDLRKQITDQQDELGRMEAQMDSLKQVIRVYEDQARVYQEERDQAVADRAVYETLFASFQAMLRAFKVPVTPLVREQSEEEQAPIDPKFFVARLAEGLRDGLNQVDKAAGHAPYDGEHQAREGKHEDVSQ
jgi:chromosome segregation ATPase